MKNGKTGENMIGQNDELGVYTGGNLARLFLFRFSPCSSIFGDNFLSLIEKALHVSLYHLLQGKVRESFQHLLFLKFLQPKIFNMPRCHILW